MFFRQIRSGGDRNFSYIVADEQSGDAVVIDPGRPPAAELRMIEENGFSLRYIINTHGHSDHTGGNDFLSARTDAQIVMHSSAPSYHDRSVNDGDTLTVGTLSLQIMHTPGHTPDSICILAGDELITGDTLFVGKVGGTGYGDDAHREFDSLRHLLTLPGHIRVWPGHDYGVRPSSTIGAEQTENPFLLRESFESFVELKKNWAQYKRDHGIA